MIKFVDGDIFKSECEVLVNPVNTVGVPGKGLALDFAKRFPQATSYYKDECARGAFRVGSSLILYDNMKYVAFFPTKKHWKNPSKIEYIECGLVALTQDLYDADLTSVAIPRLGCGLGNLEWSEVGPMIESIMESTGLMVEIYGKKIWTN